MKINKRNYLLIMLLMLLFSNRISAQTQLEMNQDAHKKYMQADLELNKIYKQLLNILDKNEKKLLIQVQKDWLKFRDSHCDFVAEQYEGGSIVTLIYSNCMEECTKNRIKDLKASLESRQE